MIPVGVLAARRAVAGGGPAFTDDFNRADSATLGASWDALGSLVALKVIDNQASGSLASVTAGQRAVTPAGSTDHYAQMVVRTVAGNSIGVLARLTGSAETGYLWRYNGSNACQLFRGSSGSYTALGSSYSAPLTAPFTLRIEAEGSTIRGYVNGVLRQTATDATHATGTYCGVRVVGNAVRVDDFEMGLL